MVFFLAHMNKIMHNLLFDFKIWGRGLSISLTLRLKLSLHLWMGFPKFAPIIEVEKFPGDPQMLGKTGKGWNSYTQMLNVWPIYLHLGSFGGKCRQIYHTLGIWVFHFPGGKKKQVSHRFLPSQSPRLTRPSMALRSGPRVISSSTCAPKVLGEVKFWKKQRGENSHLT